MISLTPRLLYPTAKEPTVPIDRIGGPQNGSALFTKEKGFVSLPGI